MITSVHYSNMRYAYSKCHTRSLHDALPIWECEPVGLEDGALLVRASSSAWAAQIGFLPDDPLGPGPNLLGQERSEEHTSELQSTVQLVWRLMFVKKKTNI